jgi:hypothetical protein
VTHVTSSMFRARDTASNDRRRNEHGFIGERKPDAFQPDETRDHNQAEGVSDELKGYAPDVLRALRVSCKGLNSSADKFFQRC